ncbi:excalibur calcium-binding domain-containing protein [Sphingomonas faeni]|uniref:excalibur calcium-binding domain-containing protein n=1 Tax=Sphingomonas faeni TaxID=185950 RepID=UPI0020BF95D3|nr:excalibur calcium-binding domain-containing protein [Sphingomonas faeni]MCK8456489.1 excalibur calcium-binding domain-containing protein [Sphingomonas faeni]
MERSFIAVTAIASTLMFAGVWKVTEPQPTASPAIVDTTAVPDPAVVAPPTLKRHVVAPAQPVVDAEPYNVVRPAYRSSTPARQSASAGSESAIFYSGCREVRAAGVAPLHRGQPGYRSGMDGDGDGIACENYR